MDTCQHDVSSGGNRIVGPISVSQLSKAECRIISEATMKTQPAGFPLPCGANSRCSLKRIALFLTLFVWFTFSGQVLGHSGGEPVISEATAGPFLLYVWLDPIPAVVGKQHITISVNTPAPDNSTQSVPVVEANVSVTARSIGDPQLLITVPALHEQAANKLFYEARLDLPESGTWQLSFEIDSGLDEAQYEMQLSVEDTKRDRWGNIWQNFSAWLKGLFSRP